uniref:Putative surfactant B-associated protein n=1 Tax=Schmidtea mediterranea TaxID=79327 RepID=A0A1W6I196_SCHMD|nr:putative surfactant B-associated protein [Schmidtea mediterranea]
MLTDAGYIAMCSNMKSTEKEKCREMILHVGRVILHKLESVLSVKSICHQIYRCPMNIEMKTEDFTFYEKPHPKKPTKQCEVCSLITNVYSNAMDKDIFEKYVVEIFQMKYCNKLFPKKENECKKFLKNELPNILNKIRVSLHKNYLCNLTCNAKSQLFMVNGIFRILFIIQR